MNYIVKSGDTLSKIARDKLGDITLWEDLAKHNKIANPNLIFPGQVISLDIPKRVTLDVTPKKPSPILNWVIGFTIAVATGITVDRITKYANGRKSKS